MDYRKIFRDALETNANELKKQQYNRNIKKSPGTTPEANINDIIDVEDCRYLVLHKYGKFHKLLNLDEGREHVINLDTKDVIVVIPDILKKHIRSYEKPEVNLERYYRNKYLTFKEFHY